MVVKILRYGSNQEYSLDGLVMTKSIMYTSTRCKNKVGRWYFEFTHVSGDNFHILGFIDGNFRRLAYYASGALPDSRVLCDNSLSPSKVDYELIGFTNVGTSSTIGLGLDQYKGEFFIRSSNQISVITFNPSKFNVTKTNIYIEEATVDKISDTVNINFGSKPFVYNNMLGFEAWGKEPSKLTKCTRSNYAVFALAFYIYLVYDK